MNSYIENIREREEAVYEFIHQDVNFFSITSSPSKSKRIGRQTNGVDLTSRVSKYLENAGNSNTLDQHYPSIIIMNSGRYIF